MTDKKAFVIKPGNKMAQKVSKNNSAKPSPVSRLAALPLFDCITEAVIAFDHDLAIISINQAAEKLSGWRSEELSGRPAAELFQGGEDEKLILSDKDGEVLSVIGQPTFLLTKPGEAIPISISITPLATPDKPSIVGGVISFRDETESVRNKIILESIGDGVFTVDRNWTITSFSRAAEKITGWSREEALGRSCSDIFRSDFCGEDCPIAMSLYSGKPIPSQVITITDKEGRKIPISVTASPLADNEGNIIGGVETFRDLTEVYSNRRQGGKRSSFGEIISKSPTMSRIFEILPEIARSDSNVLILGESGTGKELVARATHNSSNRRQAPFITVNCGALPDTLLESELFGYKAGAFTDAKSDREGRFAAAEGGTLFLDEIGDISTALQVKLLRVLQERIYEPLGSNKPVKSDVRIIAATNRDLQGLVEQGNFRDDLFYRLNVVKLVLPPLRERKEDIAVLCQHFINTFSARQGKDIVGVSEEAMDIIMQHNFPGNIRELENIIEYAFILCHSGFIMPEHLPEPFAPKKRNAPGQTQGPRSLEEIEKQAILIALERNRWKRLATCRELGISKDPLRRKISRYQLEDPNKPGENDFE
jgi:PAS domain S-box-containing protein